MRSAPSQDATTRSRIRDAAVLLFGRDGYSRTSVRAIAHEAQVSPALVIHHFGSKERLRQACDEHIVAEIFGRKADINAGDSTESLAATMQKWLADVDTHRVVLDYLAQMITDSSELGNQLYDNLVDRTEQMITDEAGAGRMRASSDLRMTAVLVATQSLMPLLLERHMSRALGTDRMDEQLVRRMTIPTLELYTDGLYADDTLLNAARVAFDPTTEQGNDQ